MNAAEFSDLLSKLEACSEARRWAKCKSLVEVWNQCERGDWLLWLCARMIGTTGWPTRQQVVLACCACVDPALKFVEAGEDRPRIAIETTRKWTRGEATIAEVCAAAAAADAAAYAADAADAAAYAADAAAYAADAAAYAADAVKVSLREIADIVRAVLPMPESRLQL